MTHARLSDSSKAALRDLSPLSQEGFREVQSVLTDPAREQSEIRASYHVAIQSKMTYDLTVALRKMDETSAALSRRLVFLTWILVGLTLVLAVEAIKHLATLR